MIDIDNIIDIIPSRNESQDNLPDSQNIFSPFRSSQLEELFIYLNTRQTLLGSSSEHPQQNATTSRIY